jgi:hypothetical protein
MLICGWRWGLSLALGILLFLGAGAWPLRADGTRSPFRGDLYQFQEELLSGGAFKFMEDTESLIRSGDFEQAFSRYLILRSHIRGQALYAGLDAMVNQRLHFLQSQMGLPEIPSYAAPSLKFKRRVRKTASADIPGPDKKGAKVTVKATATPTAAKTGDQESQASKPSPVEKPAETILPPAPTADQAATKSAEESKSPKEEAQEEKPKETPPPPPESIWDKLKRRLKFW